MMRALLAAALLSSTACFGQQGTCYTDYAGNAHCQGSDGSSGSTYQVGPITHYQWNPAPSAQSQQQQLEQLQRNRQMTPNYGAMRFGQALGSMDASRNAAYANGVQQGIAQGQAEIARNAQIRAYQEARDAAVIKYQQERREQILADHAAQDTGQPRAQDEGESDATREAYWQGELTKGWIEFGANPSEAESIAKLFKIDDELTPILNRVEREGWQVGIDNAKAAYKAHDYKLADQLAVAAVIAHRKEDPDNHAKADDKPSVERRSPSTEPSTLADELEKLRNLHDGGALTDKEFAQAKHKLLTQDRGDAKGQR